MFGLLQAFAVGLLFLSLPVLIRAETKYSRFFLMGDGKIHIKNSRTGSEASVDLVNYDFSLNEEGFSRIDEVFGYPAKEKGEHVSPRLIFMLDYFSDVLAPGKVINLESGYRSPRYNANLRKAGGNVAKTSSHLDGMAIDFNIDGVNGKELWKIIKDKDCCGVGYYGGPTIHLDSGRPRFWEAATSKVRTGESDFNRRIYLSTDYDRYRVGDTVRVSFSSVSDFGFGVGRTAVFVDDPEGHNEVAKALIESPENTECVMITDRKASRFIYIALPPTLREGRYRIKLDFCRRPFEQMPLSTVSNEIELLGLTP